MKKIRIHTAILILGIVISHDIKAQLLKKLGQIALDKVVNTGINSIMKNSSVNIGNKVYVFQEEYDENITKIGYSNGKKWHVYLENQTGGISSYFQTVCWDINYQNEVNYSFRSKSHSFDFYRLNDTCLTISHNIAKQPFNVDYPYGPKFDLFKIKDSIIYKITVESKDNLKQEVGVTDLKNYIPVAKFSRGNIYDLENSSNGGYEILGTYKNFVPHKINFIYTSIYFRFKYGKMDDALTNLLLLDIEGKKNQWLSKEKSCDECNKKFTGSAFKIGSKDKCKIDSENLGFNLLTGKWIEDTDVIFCTKKCAEKYCISH